MSDAPTHQDVVELLGAYALDAVDPDEARVVARHLEECPDCAREVAGHHEVAALMASTGDDAPEHVWSQIAARIGAAAVPGPPAVVTGTGTRARARRRRLAAAAVTVAVAAAVAAIAVLGVRVADLDHRVGQLSEPGRTGLAGVVAAAAADPAARHVVLADSRTGAAVARVVVLPSGRAYVVDSTLPALPAGRTYQLWGKVGDRFISMGVLGPKPRDVPFTLDPAAVPSLLALTAEPAGGSVRPTGSPLAAGPLPAA